MAYLLFNTKSCFSIYNKYMVFQHILLIHTHINDQTVLFQVIRFKISQSLIVPNNAMYH